MESLARWEGGRSHDSDSITRTWLHWDSLVKGSRMCKNTAYSPHPRKPPEGCGAGRSQGRRSSRTSLVFCILLSTPWGGSSPVGSLGDPVAFSVGRTEGLLGTRDSPLDDLKEITSSVSTNINIPGNQLSTTKQRSPFSLNAIRPLAICRMTQPGGTGFRETIRVFLSF